MTRDRSRGARLARLAVGAVMIAATFTLPGGTAASAPEPRRAAPSPTPVSVRAANFAVSPPVASMSSPAAQADSGEVREARPSPERPPGKGAGEDDAPASGPEPLTPAPSIGPIGAPIANFDGLSSADNAAVFGFRVLPPDPSGDIGPNHYVQMVNLLYRVYDRAGTALSPPLKLSTLFAPLGGECAAGDDGDPIVVYDELADRWLLSQFAVVTPGTSHECVAISQTGNPLGAYYLYDFVMPNEKFNDYPKFGVWPDGYYMTDNQFNCCHSWAGAGVFAFDRAKMLAGDPTASYIYFDLGAGDLGIGGMLPSDFDGLTAPPPGAPNVFAYFTANEFGDPEGDALRLFDFHADFANPGLSTFTERAESPVAVAAFNPVSPSGRADIAQPAGGVNVDSISDRLMFRLQYRNFGGRETLVANHTVTVQPSPYQAGVRWYHLENSTPGGAFGVAQQGTYAPNTDSRWMASAAMNGLGDLAVGYSVSSTTTHPSVRYAARTVTSPPNTLDRGEGTLIDGTGVQTSSSSRWGDYSQMSVDPLDDCTFWFTGEYYTAAGQASSSAGWSTRIGSFRVDSCDERLVGRVEGTVTESATGDPIPGATVSAGSGYERVTDGAGQYSMVREAGTFDMTASAPGYHPRNASGVVVTDGVTTTQDFQLDGAPLIQAAGATLVSEHPATTNGALDPGETVEVSFGLRNAGNDQTTNLVGTLEPTGGVTSPDGPHGYGAVPDDGSTHARTYRFTVDPAHECGVPVTASLATADGAADLGTLSYSLPTGVVVEAFSEAFDGVTAPALPPGWSASSSNAAIPPWATTTASPDSPPNTAFAPAPTIVNDNVLVSPSVAIPAAGATLRFRNWYTTEHRFDGGVLEISIDGSPFVDIVDGAGGTFLGGGYNPGTIDTRFGNPLAGRRAWHGVSGGYIPTAVELPAAAAGTTAVFRWRLGTDSSLTPADAGWRVDGVTIGGPQCAEVPDDPSPFRTAVLDSGPELYWRLGEAAGPTAVDETGNGHDGTYRDAWQFGLTGALAGDPDTAGGQPAGTRGRVTANPSVPNPASNFSVAMWLKDQGTTARSGYLQRGGTTSTPGWRFHQGGGKLRFAVYTDVDRDSCKVADMPSDGLFHFVVAVVGTGTIDTYLDGVLTNTCPFDQGSGAGNTAPLRLLGRNNMAADVDEVVIWHRALAAGEIAALDAAAR